MWNKIKKAAKTLWNGAKSLWKQTWNVVNEIWNRIHGVPSFFATLLGWKWPKKCRLRVVILRDENGISLLGQGSSDDVRPSPIPYKSPEEEARPAIDLAIDTYKDECNVNLVSYRGQPMVTVANTPAPQAALDVGCNWGAWGDELGGAGAYFRSLAAGMFGGLPFGYGSPITVFVVRSVGGPGPKPYGCSLAFMTNYVTVEAAGMRTANPRTLAHELGHAFSLWHTSSQDNLMTRGGTGGRELNRLQEAMVRSSPHVTTL
jgi:hypothetical protein